MSEIIKSVFGIAEKFLSLWQLWFVLLIVTGFISHAPEFIQKPLKIGDWPTLWTDISSGFFLLASTVLVVKVIAIAWKIAKQKITERRYKFSDLSDEELAVIYLYEIIETTLKFDQTKPAIKKLRKKGLIQIPYSLIYVAYDSTMDDFELTKSGHKFLKKHQAKLADLFSDMEKFFWFVHLTTGNTFFEEIP
jgi:hypothetical protein